MSREKLVKFLREHRVDAEVIDTDVETASVTASSEVLGLRREDIVKSIVFGTGKGIIVAIVRGDQRINEKKLATAVGASKVRLADSSTVKVKTGYDIGGVPPVGHDNPQITYVMDERVLEKKRVYAGGGDRKAQLSIKVRDILKLVNPKVESISIV